MENIFLQILMNVQKILTHVILMLTALIQLKVITAHVMLGTMEMEAYVVSIHIHLTDVCVYTVYYVLQHVLERLSA